MVCVLGGGGKGLILRAWESQQHGTGVLRGWSVDSKPGSLGHRQQRYLGTASGLLQASGFARSATAVGAASALDSSRPPTTIPRTPNMP